MKRLGCVLLLAMVGCPKKDVVIYRSLSEKGAMETCDANTRFRAEAVGKDAASAKAAMELQVRNTVTENKGCGALIYNEGNGKKLDGDYNAVADFQLCRCGK
jgi:hypothetical protein